MIDDLYLFPRNNINTTTTTTTIIIIIIIYYYYYYYLILMQYYYRVIMPLSSDTILSVAAASPDETRIRWTASLRLFMGNG